METLLMVVTVIALALAIGMSVLAWRLLRDHRMRSAARVEALQAFATDDGAARFAALDEDEEDDADEMLDELEEDEEHDELQTVEAWPSGRTAQRAPREEAAWDWTLGRDRAAVPAAGARFRSPAPRRASLPDAMFRAAATAAPAAPPRRWLTLAAVAALMVAGVAGVYVFYQPLVSARSMLPSWATELHAAGARPLELLSLRHSTGAGAFTVTGLVQNPAGGTALRNVNAVVYLFDRDGNYFASGKAPLEFDELQPGGEAPFVVRVPNAGRVSRYRVGFRLDEGGVIAHIDRRGQLPAGTTGDSLDAPRLPPRAAARGAEGRP